MEKHQRPSALRSDTRRGCWVVPRVWRARWQLPQSGSALPWSPAIALWPGLHLGSWSACNVFALDNVPINPVVLRHLALTAVTPCLPPHQEVGSFRLSQLSGGYLVGWGVGGAQEERGQLPALKPQEGRAELRKTPPPVHLSFFTHHLEPYWTSTVECQECLHSWRQLC